MNVGYSHIDVPLLIIMYPLYNEEMINDNPDLLYQYFQQILSQIWGIFEALDAPNNFSDWSQFSHMLLILMVYREGI